MPYIYRDNKPPIYICQDCGLNFTHFDNHMIILKDDIWLSIANKEDILCDLCIEKRLKRNIEISDLWINNKGIISEINNWYINKH